MSWTLLPGAKNRICLIEGPIVLEVKAPKLKFFQDKSLHCCFALLKIKNTRTLLCQKPLVDKRFQQILIPDTLINVEQNLVLLSGQNKYALLKILEKNLTPNILVVFTFEVKQEVELHFYTLQV
jgi:hypothetical protein